MPCIATTSSLQRSGLASGSHSISHAHASYGGLDPDEKDKAGLPLSARAVFVVGPDKKLKLSILYPATTGRNFTEVRRISRSSARLPQNLCVGNQAHGSSHPDLRFQTFSHVTDGDHVGGQDKAR